MAYLGTLGRLVELRGINSQQVEAEDRYTLKTTLEGRTKAQVRPIGSREWKLGTKNTTPVEAQRAIMAFANGEWGPGPFIFVSADAPVTNMLAPAASHCDMSEVPIGRELVVAQPPMQLPDGSWAGRSFLKDPGVVYVGTDASPVLPGSNVTVSAVVKGPGAAVRLNWRDAAGNTVLSQTSSVTAVDASPVESWITAQPPAGAVSCRICVNEPTTQYARPAITWTDVPFGWSDGQGCPKAVIHAPSRNLVLASRELRGGRYSSLSFTITEVG